MESRLRTILPFILSILLLIQSNPTGILGDETVSLTSEDSNECLTFTNVSHDYNYSQPPQYTFNISADLVNNCSDGVMYPSTLMKNDTSGIEISSDDNNWRNLIESNSSYPVEWQISRSQDIPDGTLVTFELHPTRDNCQTNCTESQNYSFQIVMKPQILHQRSHLGRFAVQILRQIEDLGFHVNLERVNILNIPC